MVTDGSVEVGFGTLQVLVERTDNFLYTIYACFKNANNIYFTSVNYSKHCKQSFAIEKHSLSNKYGFKICETMINNSTIVNECIL